VRTVESDGPGGEVRELVVERLLLPGVIACLADEVIRYRDVYVAKIAAGVRGQALDVVVVAKTIRIGTRTGRTCSEGGHPAAHGQSRRTATREDSGQRIQ
jgi:hypothetical protein